MILKSASERCSASDAASTSGERNIVSSLLEPTLA
jgi:hypothetical protein